MTRHAIDSPDVLGGLPCRIRRSDSFARMVSQLLHTQPSRKGVTCILQRRYPLQILRPIIRLYAVDVVNHLAASWVWAVHQSNQAVYRRVCTIEATYGARTSNQIPAFVKSPFHLPPKASHYPAVPTNPALLVARDRLELWRYLYDSSRLVASGPIAEGMYLRHNWLSFVRHTSPYHACPPSASGLSAKVT